jgi:predicted ribosomally synthesized peptide with nif11-like leader
MSIASLEAFLARVQEDPGLRELLATAPDAASVAAIARTAGFPVSERDLWRATAVSPDDLAPADDLAPVAEAVQSAAAGVIQAESPASGAARLDPWQQAEPPAANARAMAPGGRLPDPWLEEEPLTRFVHQAQGDAELRQSLACAPDAAAVASIAQAAGYPISEVDLWLASGTTPDELAASLRAPGEGGSPRDSSLREVDSRSDGGLSGVVGRYAGVGSSEADSSVPGPGRSKDENSLWQEDDPVSGDAPSTGATDWPDGDFSSEAEAMAATEADRTPQAAAEERIREFLRQAAADAELRQALASAPDASAVASLAQSAGHPLSELALWLASGAAFEEAQSEPEPAPPTPANDPLTFFLRAVEVDPDLRLALASAPDAATVAAIARIAGFPLTAADLWAASDAVPRELEVERWLVDEVVVEELVVEERVILGR